MTDNANQIEAARTDPLGPGPPEPGQCADPRTEALTLAAAARLMHSRTGKTASAAEHLEAAAGLFEQGQDEAARRELRAARGDLLLYHIEVKDFRLTGMTRGHNHGTPEAIARAAGLAMRSDKLHHEVLAAQLAATKPEWQAQLDEQQAREREAGERNARAQSRNMALVHAQQVHLMETTGLQMPHPADMKAGDAQASYMAAAHHVHWGDFASADVAFADAIQLAGEARDKGAVSRLEKLRAKVAAATPKEGTLPPLARMGPAAEDGSFTAIDHRGTEFTVKLDDGQVSLTSRLGSLAAPAGEDPTATARELAARLESRGRETTERAFAAVDQYAANAEHDRQEQADMRERQAQWRATQGNRDAPPDDGSLVRTEGYRTLGRLARARQAERAAGVTPTCDGPAVATSTTNDLTAPPNPDMEA
jgi:hypothetical protein